MAEIWCETETVTAAAASCEPSPRTARRRRKEIQRFRFVNGAESMAPDEEFCRKRQRFDCTASTPGVLQKGFGSEVEEPESETNLNGSRGLLGASSVELGPSDGCPRYGVIAICGRRRNMEDAVSVRPDFLRRGSGASERYHFFGVFDGHGCSHVAVSCKDRMHEMVAEEAERVRCCPLPPAEEWREVMERSFCRMDEAVARGWDRPRNASCRCKMQTPRSEHVGSTAVVTVVGPNRIVVANCGDSRAVLCRNGVPIPLSSDHKPDRPDELERIQAAGGRVIYWDGARVLGVLAMSRAIGDSYLKPYVMAEPEVTVTEREEGDDCLILASDGLWDVVTNEMACDIARMCLSAPPADGESGSNRACSEAAVLLTKLAIARQSADNVSVVVVDLRTNS
ncbi:protein phosphatase 2C 37 [Elaeis guineensis]|uniref:protein-serine/threonine phosphatase n=1 Tax=Elaeis guineensis var. tenera TaxID=51953 RepID=A0A6I9R4K0_ELAGV|nr:probable protein phosphatase 2C 68 [Elaeis guineensis]